MWNDQLVANLSNSQIVSDSKTPSGTVHVGSLRGVLIHDAIFRALKAQNTPARYIFGVDDFDPLDGLPHDCEPWLKDYMGFPLCNVPAPEGSSAEDMAKHYIADFLNIFSEIAVEAEIYYMRDIYRSGKFNQAIDTILKNSAKVRQIYQRVSKSIRPDNWHPFQVICENCGRIGTTEVTAYDGQKVKYQCKPNLVSWAQGCGHKGEVSPFDGNGKLPWKLEWVAKWFTFGVTIEGAGKDHCTKGGSRDVANACMREIFKKSPPTNVPYEFFLVEGAKMSSSKGVGTSARDMTNMLPAEILRFLMIRTAPKKFVNFSTDFAYMVKLYNDFDRLYQSKSTDEQQKMLAMLELKSGESAYHPIGFQVLVALLQLPHLDVEAEINKRSTGNHQALKKRISSAKYWLANFIADDDRIELQKTLPASVANLSQTQRAFLNILGDMITDEQLTDDEYQRIIFDASRLTPINQAQAFQAIYRALLDKDQGPKGGALFSFLKPDFLQVRFRNIEYQQDLFLEQSAIPVAEFNKWYEQNKGMISNLSFSKKSSNGLIFLELIATINNDKKFLKRIQFENEIIADDFCEELN